MKQAIGSQKIGNVELLSLGKKLSEDYSDGDVEDQILQLFRSKNPEQARLKILASHPSWPLYYHLSYSRGTLLNWYPIGENEKVLEIGAGCGAITETLITKSRHVTALELTKRRALITATRHQQSNNLRVICGNLEDLSTTDKHDVAICVGVLEYAPSYISGSVPSVQFLEQVKKSLKPNGRILIAIENKFGLKYWRGANEDHTGQPFDGINDYRFTDKKVRTYSRHEIIDLLSSCGLKTTNMYYPYPDYKTPFFVYSDDYYPGHGTSFPIELLPSPDTDRPTEQLFSESLAMTTIEHGGLFREFANSFLIEAVLA
ncbi:MAG TPA: class I SAM-dependent methyltransferase [Candidatus Saccharimonadales bacterium]|nr:class I SAM-dependent methyltransferase [Candidatus Saccharimonadales bacterium]